MVSPFRSRIWSLSCGPPAAWDLVANFHLAYFLRAYLLSSELFLWHLLVRWQPF